MSEFNIYVIPVSLVILLFGVWLNYYIKRPKLVVGGGGSGGGVGAEYNHNHVTIQNKPGVLGLRLGETTLFGWPIHGSFQAGPIIDRNEAYRCKAMLIDKETGEYICRLWWKIPTNPSDVKERVTIKSAKNMNLSLFIWKHNDPSTYFIYEPNRDSDSSPKINIDTARFSDSKKLAVEIKDYHGRKRLKFNVNLNKRHNGSLLCEVNPYRPIWKRILKID
ncbi:MAG: hypothetical protein WD885_01215 [Candidatus Saccharimonadales bacterium]